MGKDPLETIHYFGERKKLFKIHFRNVDQPLPHFVETFVDDGYADMYPVVKSLQDVNFDGVLIADHIPMMGNDYRLGTAFTVGYIKALVDRTLAEAA
jgi:mannonate dehydratase